MPKKFFRVMYALNYITQAAFCLICPAGLVILGGWFLTNRCGVGRWAMIAAIVLGVLFGLYSMFHFILKTMDHIDPTQGKGGGGDDGTE